MSSLFYLKIREVLMRMGEDISTPSKTSTKHTFHKIGSGYTIDWVMDARSNFLFACGVA